MSKYYAGRKAVYRVVVKTVGGLTVGHNYFSKHEAEADFDEWAKVEGNQLQLQKMGVTVKTHGI